jgi:chemotaxis response regulator CheB
LEVIREFRPSLILMDLNMPNASGADFVAGSFIQPALPAMTFDFSSAMGA